MHARKVKRKVPLTIKGTIYESTQKNCKELGKKACKKSSTELEKKYARKVARK